MRRLTFALFCLTIISGTGCHLANRSQSLSSPCGKARVSCGTNSEAACSPGCSVGDFGDCRSEGFGLFGKTFCDPRLSEGTAFVPWQYGYNLCVAGSQFSNTVLGGDPDESLSSRFGRAQEDEVVVVRYGLAPVTNVIVGPDHCRRCIERDEPRNKELWSW